MKLHEAAASKSVIAASAKPIPPAEEEEEDERAVQQRKEVRDAMHRERRKRLKNHQKEQDLEKQEAQSMKRVGNKKTYPMCMAYDESCNIVVFALRSGEIQLHQMRLQGAKKRFALVQSLNVENIVQCITLERHKVRPENLLLCLGTKSSKSASQSEIVIFELDPAHDFVMVPDRCFKWIWPHNEITHLLYNASFGLLAASFSGAIEIFDSIDLNHSVWYNRSSCSKFKQDCGSIVAIDYSEALDLLAFGGVPGTIHLLEQPTK